MNTKLTKIAVFISIPVLFGLTACGFLDQFTQMQNFAKCEFKLSSVNNIKAAGVDIGNIHSINDFTGFEGIAKAATLTKAFTSSEMPLSFTLNVEAKNPNAQPAGMNQLDWILMIDDQETVRGTLNKNISIAGNNGSTVIPVEIGFNLKQLLSGKTIDAVASYAFNLSGDQNKKRFTLKVKPSIIIAGYNIPSPAYFDVKF